MSENYYKILEVEPTASLEDIKKSYRRLSLKHHPDRNGGSAESVQKFQKINEAFENIGDAEKRKRYDFSNRFGSESPFTSMFGGGNPFTTSPEFETGQFPGVTTPEDLLKHIFGAGGGMPFGPMNMGSANIRIFKNGIPVDVKTTSPMSEFEMHFGGANGMESKPTAITKKITIDMITSIMGDKYPLEYERWVLEEGIKKTETVKIYVDIPMGIDTNEIIMIKDAGNIIHERCKGDVKLIITVENDTIFKRQGMDLIMDKKLSLKESLCGFTFEVKHLNGRTYTLTTPAGNVIQPGHTKTIADLGVMRDGRVGRLIVQFGVEYPSRLDEGVVEKLKEIL
jgi:DnaJ family protein B protein 4